MMKKAGTFLIVSAISLLFVLSGCAGNQASVSSSPSVSPALSSVSPSDPSQKVFTLTDLAKYNGQNGNPAYVAVSGVVYDVTNAKNWVNGTHNGHSAGQDLTKAIKQSPHGTSILSGLPVVGKLQ